MKQFLVILTALAMTCAPVHGDSPAEDAAFGERVRQYLLQNPEVILEAMEVLSAQQDAIATRALLAPHLPVLFGTEMDLRLGAADAPRVLLEFFDYNCAVCRANTPVIEAFVAANPEVAFVKKHLPILSPGSERAVRFVLATRKVYGATAYRDLHTDLYERIGPTSLNRLKKLAQNQSLDPSLIIAHMEDADISVIIEQHRDIAIALNVAGTPTFVTLGGLHVGAVTAEILTHLAEDT